jgi:hypothetical protein
MKLNSPWVTAGKARFVACARARRLVQPLLVDRHTTMSGSKVLISPAVFTPGKLQASRPRFYTLATPAGLFNKNAVRFAEGKFRSNKSNQPRSNERTPTAPN